MFVLAALLLFQSDPTASFAADLRSCGIDEKRALTDYRDDLQDRETGVTGSAPVSDQQMGCLATVAARNGYFVEFADPALNRRFFVLYESKMREEGRMMARQELAKRGLLATAPAYDANQPLSAYAAKVEMFCGVKVGDLLRVIGPKTLTIDPPGLKFVSDKVVSDQIECVLYTVQAANLDTDGVAFGFVGNEAKPPQRKSRKRRRS